VKAFGLVLVMLRVLDELAEVLVEGTCLDGFVISLGAGGRLVVIVCGVFLSL
jgi:hypothetical protein